MLKGSGQRSGFSLLIIGIGLSFGASVFADALVFRNPLLPTRITASQCNLFLNMRVKNSISRSEIIYAITNRSRERLIRQKIFPATWVDPEHLKGKRILDLGCGRGKFVGELRREGVEAYGVDLLRSWRADSKIFFQADMANTPFANEQFDIIFSSNSGFSYEAGTVMRGIDRYRGHYFEDLDALKSMFDEAARLLKPGGLLRISPVWQEAFVWKNQRLWFRGSSGRMISLKDFEVSQLPLIRYRPEPQPVELRKLENLPVTK